MEIRGITVFLCQKIATGKDPFNKPAYITPTYGDANLDGKINSDDISYIEQHLQGTASTEEAEAILGRMIVAKAYTGAELADPVRAPLADVNEDGIVNTEDVAIVQSYIDGTPQSPTIVGEEKKIRVDNVLVSPTTTEDASTMQNLTGKRTEYTLAIPKGDTNNWEDSEVEFWGRRWRTIGFTVQGIEELIPLAWHKKVMVEAYE